MAKIIANKIQYAQVEPFIKQIIEVANIADKVEVSFHFEKGQVPTVSYNVVGCPIYIKKQEPIEIKLDTLSDEWLKSTHAKEGDAK